jgi:hypothetical protein
MILREWVLSRDFHPPGCARRAHAALEGIDAPTPADR